MRDFSFVFIGCIFLTRDFGTWDARLVLSRVSKSRVSCLTLQKYTEKTLVKRFSRPPKVLSL
uniref:Uncharacterized protein n=1 Tax=uncultured bacterium Rlip1 TaxID=581114 RepID=C0K069_9BACT|nr:unknown [uncultured bacterium Rlip1]